MVKIYFFIILFVCSLLDLLARLLSSLPFYGLFHLVSFLSSIIAVAGELISRVKDRKLRKGSVFSCLLYLLVLQRNPRKLKLLKIQSIFFETMFFFFLLNGLCLWLSLADGTWCYIFLSHRIGCILLSVGQNEFHGEVLHTLNYVVNQSDYTVEILRNVTEYLSLAKAINVAQIFLPSDILDDIDKLTVDLNSAADTLMDKTSENSVKIQKVFNLVYVLFRWWLSSDSNSNF